MHNENIYLFEKVALFMINKNTILEIIWHHCELLNIPVIIKKNFDMSIVKGSLISEVIFPLVVTSKKVPNQYPQHFNLKDKSW